MRRTAARGLAILTLGALAAGAPAGAVTVTGDSPLVETRTTTPTTAINAEVFERLPTGRNVQDILLLVPGAVDGQKVDQVQVGLGKGLAGDAKPNPGLGDWKWKTTKGGYLVGTPPVLVDGQPATQYSAGGFTLPKDAKLPDKIEVQLYGNGKPLYGEYRPVRPLNPPILLNDPKPAIRLPQTIRPGNQIWFRPRDFKYTPGGGQWKIGPFTPKWNGSFDKPSYKFDIPLDFKLGTQLKVSYRDPWGETLVDGPATDIAFGPPAGPPKQSPAVTGCSPATLDTDTFCLCGNFPANSAADLLINGRSIGQYLVSVSPTIVNVALPADFPAGALDVSAGASSGFDIVDGARGALIHVGGKIDRNRLKRGQSTTLELWLDGTDRATDLRLRNLTPQVVAIENGNDQVVTTSGGTPNQVTRKVDAVSVGDFNLQYELAVGSCPCANDLVADAGGDAETTADGDDHPVDDGGVETGQDMGDRPGEDDDDDEILDRWVTREFPKKDYGETGVDDDGKDDVEPTPYEPGDDIDDYPPFEWPDDPLAQIDRWEWRDRLVEWDRVVKSAPCSDEEVMAWRREIERQKAELAAALSQAKKEIAELGVQIAKWSKDSTIVHRQHVAKYRELEATLARLQELAKALAALPPCRYIDTAPGQPHSKEICDSNARYCDELKRKMIEAEAKARELRRRAEHPDASQPRDDRDADRLEREAEKESAQVGELLQQAAALRGLQRQALETAGVAAASAKVNPKSGNTEAAARAEADAATWGEQAQRLEDQALELEKSSWRKRAEAARLRDPKGAGDRAAAEAERVAREARQAWLDCLAKLKRCAPGSAVEIVEYPEQIPHHFDEDGGKIVEIGPLVPGKPTDDPKKKPRCGPDVTPAFEDALRRVTLRWVQLPDSAKGPSDASELLDMNWPWAYDQPVETDWGTEEPGPDDWDWGPLIEWNNEAEGCAAEWPCAQTSTLWGLCLPKYLIQEAFGDYVGELFHARDPQPIETAAVQPKAPGRVMGQEVGRAITTAAEMPDLAELQRIARDAFERALKARVAELGFTPACYGCLECPATITSFPDDWSAQDWYLPHGGHQTATGDIVRPPAPAF